MPTVPRGPKGFDRDLVTDVLAMVAAESPSADRAAVAKSADVVARVGDARTGVAPQRVVSDGRTHLLWRFGPGPTRVLLLGHHDTVWPIGSLDRRPAEIVHNVLRGPGCLDMKTGLAMAFGAVAAVPDPTGVALLITGDEEIGSPTSRDLIKRTAAGCDAVLVLEAAAHDGAVKTERAGVSTYDIAVTGRAAHAGLEPERGVNAAVEIAHQLLAIAHLGDTEAHTTVTPTIVRAGTTANTVPATARLVVDVRTRTAAEQRRVDRRISELRPVTAGAHVDVTGGPNRPPLPAASSRDLYARLVRVAARLGWPGPEAATVGGASDGNLTAGVGTPTLDGLGAIGGGAHADDEHVDLLATARRFELVTALLSDLLAAGRPLAARGVPTPGSANKGKTR